MPRPNIGLFSTVHRTLRSSTKQTRNVDRFVEHVTHGDVDKVQKMMLDDHRIVLERSTTVTDIGGRRFAGLKAGTYAMWNRDTEMLQAMLNALRILARDVQHTSYAAEQTRKCLVEQFRALDHSGLSYEIKGVPRKSVLNERYFDPTALLDAMKQFASASAEERSARDYGYPIFLAQSQLPPSLIRIYRSGIFSGGVSLSPEYAVLFNPPSPPAKYPEPWGGDLDPNSVLVRCAHTTPFATTNPDKAGITSDYFYLKTAIGENEQRFKRIMASFNRPLQMQTSDCNEEYEQGNRLC